MPSLRNRGVGQLLTRVAWRYRIVSLTILVCALFAALMATGHSLAADWIAASYALAAAVGYAIRMCRAIAEGRIGVDLLAIVAITATVLVREILAALIVILMLSGGEALEDYAHRRAGRDLNALLERAPRTAHREHGDDLVDIPVDSVRVDDVLLVRPAEVVPVDSALISNFAVVDASSITGESFPIEKRAGDEVLSGSINGPEAIRVRATAVAAESQFQQIAALVAGAAQSRPKTVRLADRFAAPFTVFSLLLAAAAWVVSGQPVRFAEVLVLATPCPLLIAAPVAFIAGMSRAARRGIIVRSGGVFESLAAARTVVFDKTGTLTSGHPALSRVIAQPGFTSDEVLALAASAEQYSSHVLAASVVRAARDRALSLGVARSAEEHATDGVLARIGDREVAVGKLAFVHTHAADARSAPIVDGELVIYVAVDGRYAGSLIERDSPRRNASSTLARLGSLGIRDIELLTGDSEATARGIAAELGISRFQAECLPADKVRHVAAITARPVVMVGDGVNDAPVLARADVGIALGAKGSTAASESADVVLLVDDIGGVADAVEIGRRTLAIALQSIWFGIAASVALMSVAAFGLIPATTGALLQEAVDLTTIVAALRAGRPSSADITERSSGGHD